MLADLFSLDLIESNNLTNFFFVRIPFKRIAKLKFLCKIGIWFSVRY
jgi:hypothetical protein